MVMALSARNKEMAPWLMMTQDGTLLRVVVQPRASRSEIIGLHGDRLKIRIAAPPVDGEANNEILQFLKKRLKVTLSDLILIRGESSKLKDILCRSLSSSQIYEILNPESLKDKKIKQT